MIALLQMIVDTTGAKAVPKTEITRDDVMPLSSYLEIRKRKRREIADVKRDRRVAVGPFATFHFESWETMWYQLHEMLAIERGGEEQIDDELKAYNPLVPKGADLVATVMFEVEDPVRRVAVLSGLGGVEEAMSLSFAGEKIIGRSEADVDRTNAAGKASSVQFVHFDFTPAQIEKFRVPDTRVVVGIEHPGYGHMAVMPEAVRKSLAADFAS